MDATPEMVVCFVPGEGILGAALAADPELHEHAMRRNVVLASPATLLALLRTVAYTWRQEALTEGARELLDLGRQLYDRLGALGRHTEKLGATLRRSVEAYNALVGSLEGRVLVTTRRMAELGLATDPVATPQAVTAAPRPLTAVELIEALDAGRRAPAAARAADVTRRRWRRCSAAPVDRLSVSGATLLGDECLLRGGLPAR